MHRLKFLAFGAVSTGSGAAGDPFVGSVGSVGIEGWRAVDPGTQRAMIFDAECLPWRRAWACSGQDPDLFFPGQGNILIVSEDLDSSDLDDATDGSFRFDFSDLGSVTIESVVLLDTSNQASQLTMSLAGGGTARESVPGTGDNGRSTVTLGVGGVRTLEIDLGGLGAIDDIVVRVDGTPPATTTSSTTPTTTSRTWSLPTPYAAGSAVPATPSSPV